MKIWFENLCRKGLIFFGSVYLVCKFMFKKTEQAETKGGEALTNKTKNKTTKRNIYIYTMYM